MPNPLDLDLLKTLAAVADTGSFSAAARRLGLTPAAVSKNVARLENHLGLRLFQRSAIGSVINSEQHLALFHFLALGVIHFVNVTRDAGT